MNGLTFEQKELDRIADTYPEGDAPDWENKAYHDLVKVVEAFKVIVDYGNNMSRKPEQTAEIIGDVLESTHRTLQQGVMSALINVIVNYADARCDGRNEYSVKTCRAIKDFLDKEHYIYNGRYSAPLV